MDITWEDPPTPQRGPGSIRPEEVEFSTALRANPDRWAVFRKDIKPHTAGNLAKVIREGRRAAFRVTDDDAGEFESVSRSMPGTSFSAVYVRYVTDRVNNV